MYAIHMLKLLLTYFCAAIAVTAPTPVTVMPSFSLIYSNNASSHTLVDNLTPSSLSNSTANSANPPPNPWIRETSARGTVVLSNYGSATWLHPYQWQADVGKVLAQAQAEVIERTGTSLVPGRLDYSEEHAYLYVKPLLPGVRWSIWSAALEQILYFNRNWNDCTFYFQIIQPSGLGPGSVTRVVANGQLRVRY